MPAPHWIKLCWQGSRFCGECVAHFILWSIWLVLGLIAGVQIYIASAREVPVPGFVLNELETRMATAGVHITFGPATFDPTGHLLLQDVSFAVGNTQQAALTAGTVHLKFDPWALARREAVLESFGVAGADIFTPAMLSPSGRREKILANWNADFVLNRDRRELTFASVTGRIGSIPVSAHGAVRLPRFAETPEQPWTQTMQSVTRGYLSFCRAYAPRLLNPPEMDGLTLDLALLPEETFLARVLVKAAGRTIETAVVPWFPEGSRIVDWRLATELSLAGGPQLQTVVAKASRLDWGKTVSAEDIDLRTEVFWNAETLRVEPSTVRFRAAKIEGEGLAFRHVSGQSTLAAWPRVQAQLNGEVWGEGWQVETELNAETRAGQISFETHLPSSAIAWTGERLNFNLPEVLNWEQPPALAGTVRLETGGKLANFEAAFSTGPVVARRVPLDATRAEVAFSNNRLDVQNITLKKGVSLAIGSYGMDMATKEFRFLLDGRLNPPDIKNWFRDWWPRFWTHFDFGDNVPLANVDVAGVWGKPLDTTVWVSADAKNAEVRGLDFSRVRTRLFVRPGWTDVLEFIADGDERRGRGWFARQALLPGNRWTRVELDAAGISRLDILPALLGDLGERIVEPFDFESPLELSLRGSFNRDDEGAPVESDLYVQGRAPGNWKYQDFPMQDVSFAAHRANNRILIENFVAGVANGEVSGRIELLDGARGRTGSFDLNLTEAHLGETIRTVENWSARRHGEPRPPQSDFQRQIADGQLNISISASGPTSNPLGFEGAGNAEVTGAALGEINLLGILSTMLSRTVLNFTTLQLDTASANFQLHGPELVFDEFRLTGPSATVDTDGSYRIDTKSLNFGAKIRPFEGRRNLLNTVLTPLTHVFEVKLTGRIDDPDWAFVYGPTNFLRSLTGDSGPAAPVNSDPIESDAPHNLPTSTAEP